ncbi:MAG TPA: CRISPR-associated endonuclease Cas2 [Candidatus Tyrphobacter sp.]|nr:CRISPR-associated endonuclease Cas2 [Candidatus Tyrphobacter sp.]
MEKINITKLILEKIAEGVEESGDLIIALLTAGYGASYKELEHAKEKASSGRLNQKWLSDKKRIKQNAFNNINYLIRQGFISRDSRHKFFLTRSGGLKLKEYKERGSLPQSRYDLKKSVNWVLVAFDVPEKERRKRDWLRSALKNMGFQSVQKSFFIGQIKIPETFLKDLTGLNLINCVEIVEMGRHGTLERLTDY